MDIWPDRFVKESDLTIELTLTEDELTKGKSFLQRLSGGAPRVIVYHPGAGKKPNQWPADLFARIADELFDFLDAPVRRLGAKDVYVPYHPVLEDAVLPQVSDVVRACKELAAY